MARINLTFKSQSEQIRIMKDYLLRRYQHKGQGEITIDNLVKRFRHNRCQTNRAKTDYFYKLFKMVQQSLKNSEELTLK